jgi:SAM-dependent methyltransferase
LTDIRELYASAEAVEFFASDRALQPLEAALLERLRPELGDAVMLDIGIGAGRTTAHFAPAVREYVGADYAPPMIEAARKRFGDRYRLEIGDARALQFSDACFDFVLFSYNGIDHLPTAERLIALREIRRVLRKGGRGLISSHNLLALPEIMSDKGADAVEHNRRAAELRSLNPPVAELLQREHILLDERVLSGTDLVTYYIHPAAYLAQMEESGFGQIEICGDPAADRWLYFLAVAV